MQPVLRSRINQLSVANKFWNDELSSGCFRVFMLDALTLRVTPTWELQIRDSRMRYGRSTQRSSCCRRWCGKCLYIVRVCIRSMKGASRSVPYTRLFSRKAGFQEWPLLLGVTTRLWNVSLNHRCYRMDVSVTYANVVLQAQGLQFKSRKYGEITNWRPDRCDYLRSNQGLFYWSM